MSNNEEPLYYEDIASDAKAAYDRINERAQRGSDNPDLYAIETRMQELKGRDLSKEEESEAAELREKYNAALLRNLDDKKH